MDIKDKIAREKLVEYRKIIDRIDDNIHDLLIERADIAKKIADVKNLSKENITSSAYRPAREANMIRRLLKRHRGHLPFSAIVRIWREIIATFTHMQSPYAMYIYDLGNCPHLRDASRFHYGSLSKIETENNPLCVVKKLLTDKTAIGLIPVDINDNSKQQNNHAAKEPWWRELAKDENTELNVIAALPFIRKKNDNNKNFPSILVLSHVPFEESGNDTSLIYISLTHNIDKNAIESHLSDINIQYYIFDNFKDEDKNEYILAINGYHDLNSGIVQILEKTLNKNLYVIKPIGGFANPIIY